MRMTGAQAVVQCLEQLKVEYTFGLCGHGNLALLDTLTDSSIQFLSVYHEQVATHAADAYFRISGKPGVVITTIGPGLTNTITALLDAQMDSSAVVVIAGDVPLDYVGKGALQEVQLHEDSTQSQIFRPFTKRVYRPLRVEQIPDMVARAFATATSGCPGPVLVSIPLDLFSRFADLQVGDIQARQITGHRLRGDAAAIQRAANVLLQGERPLIFAGGGVLLSQASEPLIALAEHLGIPVVTTMSGQGSIPGDHPLAAGFSGTVGTPVANRLAREADVILAVGTRFPEMDCNSWSPDHFWQSSSARLIHIDIEPFEIGKIYETTEGIVGDARTVLEELVTTIQALSPVRDWRESIYVRKMQSDQVEWHKELEAVQLSTDRPMQPARVLREVRKALPRDGILVSGVGIRHAVAQHFPVFEPRTMVVASGYGTMGQEMPAPIGVKLAQPNKQVIAVVGDGAFHAMPMAVGMASVYNIPVVWVVLNNGGYASIAIYQHKHYGRYQSTYFRRPDGTSAEPDTVGIARAYGVEAIAINDPAELADALQKALQANKPYVIDVRVSERPSIRASGHWDVNDIMKQGTIKEDQ